MKYFVNLFCLVAFVFLIFSSNTFATIHNITIGNNFFSPLGTTINHGDTVRWTWAGGIPHSTTADVTSPKIWDSGTSSAPGFTFDLVITAGDGNGPFPYHCSVHLGMKDTIFVSCTDDDADGYCIDVDCDDNNPDVNPGAQEICNGIDDDCDGFVDDDDFSVTGTISWYPDNDNDGYGDGGSLPIQSSCEPPPNSSINNSDCNDSDASINPGAFDIPGNGIDEDCDGLDSPAVDNDLDGFTNDVDCDDNNPDVNPDADEVCNGIDDDCDGFVDDDDFSLVDPVSWYPDLDNDFFGDGGSLPIQSSCEPPPNSSINNEDCDDTDPTINPSAFDIPDDGIDQDCDGVDGTGCCIGNTGDINDDGGVLPDISDLLFLVDYMFLPPGDAPEPPCMDEANVNGLGAALPDISDLLYLVDFMFLPPGNAPAPVACP